MSAYTSHHGNTCLNDINKNIHTFLIYDIGDCLFLIYQIDRQYQWICIFGKTMPMHPTKYNSTQLNRGSCHPQTRARTHTHTTPHNTPSMPTTRRCNSNGASAARSQQEAGDAEMVTFLNENQNLSRLQCQPCQRSRHSRRYLCGFPTLWQRWWPHFLRAKRA